MKAKNTNVIRVGISIDRRLYDAGQALARTMHRPSFSNLVVALIADEASKRGVVIGKTKEVEEPSPAPVPPHMFEPTPVPRHD